MGRSFLSFEVSVDVLFDWLLDDSSDGLFSTLEPRNMLVVYYSKGGEGRQSNRAGCWSSVVLMTVVRLRRWIAGVGLLAVAELALSSAVVSMVDGFKTRHGFELGVVDEFKLGLADRFELGVVSRWFEPGVVSRWILSLALSVDGFELGVANGFELLKLGSLLSFADGMTNGIKRWVDTWYDRWLCAHLRRDGWQSAWRIASNLARRLVFPMFMDLKSAWSRMV